MTSCRMASLTPACAALLPCGKVCNHIADCATALTFRNGHALSPLANTLFPGDLVTFSVGDRIPADIRLITAVSLEIDESALTGETRPSRKNTEQCERGEGEDTHGEGGGKALGERHCMAFMGTLVRSGMANGDSPSLRKRS